MATDPAGTTVAIGPSPFLLGIERDIADCFIDAEDLQLERSVRGDEWFSQALPEWVAVTDRRLDAAGAGDLLKSFRANGAPPDTTAEQVDYLDRQVALLREAFQRLRA